MTSLPRNMRQTSKKARRLAGGLCASMALISQALAGGGNLAKQGAQFAIAGALPGEQTGSRLVLGQSSGLLVWQDNGIDGSGRGIAAASVQGSGVQARTAFAVNQAQSGDQDSPDVAMLSNGTSLVVWRSVDAGGAQVFGRLVDGAGKALGNQFRISSGQSIECLTPAVAALEDGSAVVTWSQRSAGSVMLDVYFQRVTANGTLLGESTQAHQYADLHQRNPDIAGLKGGGFVVAWISEEQSGAESIDLFARVFNASGVAQEDEFRVNTGDFVCANPVVAGLKNGGFITAWSSLDASTGINWDVQTRSYQSNGASINTPTLANTFVKGRQYRPRIAVASDGPVVVWTSYGQDGWDEGVFGRKFNESGEPAGDEIQINSAWEGKQTEPDIASNGSDSAMVVWSAYSSSSTSFDLTAQVLGSAVGELPALEMPFVYSTSPTRLNASWAKPAGLEISKYEVFLDDNSTAELTSNSFWSSKAMAPGSTHTVRIGYQLADGRRGPLSITAQAATWGEDSNGDGVPDDWQTLYFGENQASWPAVTVDTDGDGATDRSEFLSGTNPRNAASLFTLSVNRNSDGLALEWATQQGFVYQVQRSTDLTHWQDLDGARIAPSGTDTLPIEAISNSGFYRVIRVR